MPRSTPLSAASENGWDNCAFLAPDCRDLSNGGIALEPALRAWALSAPDEAAIIPTNSVPPADAHW
ncbi:MAG: hypothetical protein O9286_12135 [Aquidulcibacter sp.]|uniref:hypothetical protein n=1 Tax=Aquidulcibacter sp. TaxID=2052990 RepID=UPI0022C7B521|nr:hypothetical protein [Aquidulcibacter sp.]